jgi:hypothetical protein
MQDWGNLGGFGWRNVWKGVAWGGGGELLVPVNATSCTAHNPANTVILTKQQPLFYLPTMRQSGYTFLHFYWPYNHGCGSGTDDVDPVIF